MVLVVLGRAGNTILQIMALFAAALVPSVPMAFVILIIIPGAVLVRFA